MLTTEELLRRLSEKFPKASRIELGIRNYPTFKLAAAKDLTSVVRWLKEDMGFDYLDMLTAVDYKGPVEVKGFISDPNPNAFLPEGATPQIEAVTRAVNFPYRDSFEVVYCLSNLKSRIKIFLKVELPRDGANIPSLVPFYKAADWQEREVYDLFGVRFEGHPNLTKILTPDFIQGHPLRKDYVHVKDRFD